MKINKITINNFKSFDKTEIEFGNVNMIIGVNASGKSNFIQVFELLKSIQQKGIQKAVNDFGGIGALKNYNTNNRSFGLAIEIDIQKEINTEPIDKERYIARVRDKIIYEIEFMLKGEYDFQIRENIKFVEYFCERTKDKEIKNLTPHFEYGVRNKFGKFETYPRVVELVKGTLSTGEQFKPEIENPFHRKFIEELNKSYEKKSILEYPGVFIPNELFDFGIFDIDPKKAKLPNKDRGELLLDKDGSNLTRIINAILSNDENNEQFNADVSGILEFVEEIDVKSIEGILYLKVKEIYNKLKTDGEFLSDGTINIIAAIVALYYQPNNIVFFEEPEHGIHPSLVADLVYKFYDVTQFRNTQIFITSHNEEVLKNIYQTSELKDIYLINRNEKSCSIIEKTENKELVKAFLKNEMGIDELFVNNLLDE